MTFLAAWPIFRARNRLMISGKFAEKPLPYAKRLPWQLLYALFFALSALVQAGVSLLAQPVVASTETTNAANPFLVKKGFRIESVATEPLVSPAAIAFDEN